MASKKEIHALIKLAIESGWRVEPTKGGHYKWTAPERLGIFFSSSTPSDNRAIANIKGDLRRLGLNIKK